MARAMPTRALSGAPMQKAHCPLCQSRLRTKGLLHTPDFAIVIRNEHAAELTAGEAAVFRELFKQGKHGFRIERERLLALVYSGAKVPLTADHVFAAWMTRLREKLRPLNMGILCEDRTVTLLFVAPKIRKMRANGYAA